MSITRNWLKGIGVEPEKIDAIIESHTEVTNRMQGEIDDLKEQVTTLKADAKKLPNVQKELDEATKKIADYEELQKKYDDEHKAFEDFKKDVESKNTMNAVKDAYKALLKANSVDEKRFETIMRVTDFANLKLNKDGKFDNEKELAEAIKADWADFIVTTGERGEHAETPPANSGAPKMTKDEIMKIKDTGERQKAIAENPELFGIE